MSLHGILAIEGDLYGDFNASSSTKPILDLVGQGWERRPAFAHRDVDSREELARYLARWGCHRARRYGILHLSFHGGPGEIYVGQRSRSRSQTVSLEDLAQMIGTKRSARVIHFSACSTLAVDRRRIHRFVERTGVVAVTGYARDVDWLESAAMEVFILSTLLRYDLTLAGARRMDRALRRVSYLRRELGFRMVIRDR